MERERERERGEGVTDGLLWSGEAFAVDETWEGRLQRPIELRGKMLEARERERDKVLWENRMNLY